MLQLETTTAIVIVTMIMTMIIVMIIVTIIVIVIVLVLIQLSLPQDQGLGQGQGQILFGHGPFSGSKGLGSSSETERENLRDGMYWLVWSSQMHICLHYYWYYLRLVSSFMTSAGSEIQGRQGLYPPLLSSIPSPLLRSYFLSFPLPFLYRLFLSYWRAITHIHLFISFPPVFSTLFFFALHALLHIIACIVIF